MAIACRRLNPSGRRTSQSPRRRARWARQPLCFSPTPKPLSITASPGRQAGFSLARTMPAPSMPATIGQSRTTGDRLVMARPSL
ncbi:Uncharacterised protein [Bordetella pertussis]|nr:Uncharacterised protein [Bordetella pertussis]